MHNNIMAAGSRDRPPMLATGRYAQWRSRFLRYIDTRPNGDALRKCILKGPYTPTIVTTPAVPATEDSPAVPEQTTVETVMNMTPENRAHFESEKEAIHLILTGIGDEIYSTIDACQTAQENYSSSLILIYRDSLTSTYHTRFWAIGIIPFCVLNDSEWRMSESSLLNGSKAFKTLEVLYHCQPLPTDYNRSSLGSLLIEIHTHQRIAEIGAYEGGYYDADVLADVGSYCYGLLRIDDHLETVGASHLVASGRKTSWHMALRMRSFINFVMIRDDTRRRLSALTWWYSHKRTIRTEAEFAMSWRELMKLITKVYCPRNEIQKIESELWNLTVKNNYLAAYTQRFQELTMMCTKMVLEEEDRVEKFIGGLPDNIQGNVIAAETSRLQDVVRIANNLMDQKLNEMLEKCREKNKIGGQSEDNRWTAAHQFKRPNVGVKSGESLKRTATMRENHIMDRCLSATSDCKVTNPATSNQRGQVVNQIVVTCFECGRQGHYRSDCPKLKDQNRGNKTRNKNGVGEARGKAYVLGGGDANPDSNVIKSTFLLNNHYASMIFDLGADRSFMSTTFSTLLDITPNTLDVSYAVKLADRRISKTNTVLRGCTLGLLGNPFNIDLMPVELGSFNVMGL
ncbi:reverse transcriptase domain-containing protein [Tanacetum coccineum]